MPFVLRQIEPVALSRGVAGRCDDLDAREAISNATLSACLRQLASLVKFAADMFADFESQAGDIDRRSRQLRTRLDRLQDTVDHYDSRTLPVPEGDLATFSQSHKTIHFKSATSDAAVAPVALNAFVRETRPPPVELLYGSARPAVTPIVRHLSGSSASGDPCVLEAADYDRLLALGATLRRKKRIQHKMDVLDIETRRPASLAQLREWLADHEAIGHLAAAVGTDNHRPVTSKSCDGTIHKLPSPEEKARAAAQVFAAQVISMDVTGRGFERMTQFRRSLMHVEYREEHAPHRHGAAAGGQRRRSKRHAAKKRRNTIACDGDRRDIHDAIHSAAGSLQKEDKERSESRSSLRQRLNLVHLLRTGGTSGKNSAAGSSWSAAPASDVSYDEADTTITQTETDATSHASSDVHHQAARAPVLASIPRVGDTLRPRRLGSDHTFLTSTTVQVHRAESDRRPEPSGGQCQDPAVGGGETEAATADAIYETVPEAEREFGTLGVVRPPPTASVKLRGVKDSDGRRSSSGNWSGSSSTRASMDSDHPKSGGAGSASLSPPSRRQRHLLTASNRSLDSALSDCGSQSASGAHPPQRPTNQSAASPDEAHQSAVSDTSSIYSCDAEGYYTSFHIDSGLKTLKEGQSESNLSRSQPLTHSGSRSSDTTRTTPGDNEYELFGRGSTSTTTSSIGTVIFRPEGPTVIPERRKSAPPEPPPRNRDTVVVGGPSSTSAEEKKSEEPAPEGSARSPLVTETHQRAGDGTESEAESRERIRQVTRIGRIPALCVVTPPPSDDESIRSASVLESHIQMTFLQHVAGDGSAHPAKAPPPRVNLMEQSQVSIPPPESNQIVIKASVVKSTPESGGLVSLDALPAFQSAASPLNGNADSLQAASSAESSRSSSLERKRRQGARVTLDADGKVVYSSDSLRRRKGAHTTFEPGPHIRSDSAASATAQDAKSPRPTEPSAFRSHVRSDPLTPVHSATLRDSKTPRPVESSAVRPVPIGSGLPRTPESSRRLSAPTIPPALSPPSCVAHVNGWRQHRPSEPPPFRPAPSFARTQPDGDTGDGRSSNNSPPNGAGISRSDSYKMANEDKVNGSSPFQRNDSYRMANQGHRPANGQLNGNYQRSTSASGMLYNNSNNNSNNSSNNSNKPRTSAPLDPLDVWNLNGRVVVDGRRSSSPAIRTISAQRLKSPVRTNPLAHPPVNPVNPNVNGRRTYGGPRVLLNPKSLPPGGSSSSLNSTASGDGSIRIEQSALKSPPDNRRTVVRPPTSLHERPSFFTSEPVPPLCNAASGQSPPSNASGDVHSPIPGYQSLSPPPRMSALPLAVPGSSAPSYFQRHRYNSLPARFKSDDRDRYARWLPAPSADRSDSPEEGGFLEYNNNKKSTAATPVAPNGNGRSSSSSSDGDAGFHSGPLSGATNTSPTPSLSSCSLDMSFTSSVADSVAPTLGVGWPTNASRPSSRASLDSPAGHSQRHLLVRRNSDVTAAFNRSVTPEVVARGAPLSLAHRRQVVAPVLSPVALTKPTPMLDFKRKLLQQSQKTSPSQRISAVELLKATKPPPSAANSLNNNSGNNNPQEQPQCSPSAVNPAPDAAARRIHRVSYISNRLTNRRWCNSPRTDVLSATIVEGRSEEELADSRPDSSARRHLNFSSSPRRRTPSSGSSTPIETSL